MLRHSPTAIRCLKAAFNAETDGLAGIQELAGQATHLFYRTEEGQEGRNAFLEKRPPDFSGAAGYPEDTWVASGQRVTTDPPLPAPQDPVDRAAGTAPAGRRPAPAGCPC